jgi:hypothetical protein
LKVGVERECSCCEREESGESVSEVFHFV